jgi:hypothetical protein
VRKSRSRWLPVLTVALLLLPGLVSSVPAEARSLTTAPASQTSSTLPPYPSALPNTLWLGLGNDGPQLSWMTGSGSPWYARYVYLAGGVNTGHSWTTWNTPSGAYATNYMNASAAAGYVPVFTYDQLLASLPHTGSGESAQDLSNLANPSTMFAYYSEWQFLMTLCGQYGKTVIVHLEPDLMGYIELSDGNNATATPAAVASSGFPQAAGYPNTAAGFAQVLVHLRDLYAPNVLLAFNVSPWASGQDVSTSTQSLDIGTLAQDVATFYQSLGANFDLLFYQVASRDAAYFQYVLGDGTAYWWDMSNQTVPNFSRFAQWTLDLTLDTGKRGVLWHVPIGNNVYDTENNTTGHYQDNKVVYFLGPNRTANLTQFADAGIIGIMFGAGNPQCTNYFDQQGDGITNPAPIDGNTKVSIVSDDDGGYLRFQGKAYYHGTPIALP